MSKSKLLKYEVINTKKDKKLIGEVFDFKKVKGIGGNGNSNVLAKKQKSTRDLLVEFMDEQRKFNGQQLGFNTRMEKEVSNLRNDLNRIVKLNNLKK